MNRTEQGFGGETKLNKNPAYFRNSVEAMGQWSKPDITKGVDRLTNFRETLANMKTE